MSQLEIVQTPFGLFQIDPRDIIGSTLKAGTLWDGPGFLEVIAREYARFDTIGETIIDIGANIGSFSIYCAAQGAWRVIAVEPVKVPTYQMLQANLDLNKHWCAASVIPLNVAAYNIDTVLRQECVDPGNIGGTSLYPGPFEECTIPAGPLDAWSFLFGQHVSLIKCDAQGCDLRALQGLEKTILKDRPAIVFEWDELLAAAHSNTLLDVSQFMYRMGYHYYPWPTHRDNFLALPRVRPL